MSWRAYFTTFGLAAVLSVGCLAKTLDVGQATETGDAGDAAPNPNPNQTSTSSSASSSGDEGMCIFKCSCIYDRDKPECIDAGPQPTPEELAQDPNAPNYLMGFGFAAKGGYAIAHQSVHFPDHDLRGVFITGFGGDVCDRASVQQADRGVMFFFAKEAGDIPPVGTYTFAEDQTNPERTVLGYPVLLSLACGAISLGGDKMISGTLQLTRSDAEGMTGSFEGVLLYRPPQSEVQSMKSVSGRFNANRCVGSVGACAY